MIEAAAVWWSATVAWVTATYHVNPYIFIFLYVISIPPYFWGLFDIARGTYYAATRRTMREWRVIVRGVIVNQAAWFLPYAYVMVVARSLPWFVWVLLVVMVTFSVTYFFVQLNRGGLKDRLPKFLRERVTPVETHADAEAPSDFERDEAQ